MKKIFSLIAVLMLLSGCDDGDMTFKTFDFSAATTAKCTVDSGILYYKISGTEALILELAEGQLTNVLTYDPVLKKEVPKEISISGTTNKVTYINYASGTTPTPSTMCTRLAAPAAATDERWIGTGVISVLTTAKTGTTAPNIGKITGYDHQITLKNITFTKGVESITINNNLYGTITIDNGFTFEFLGTDTTVPPIVKRCENNELLYTNKETRALVADISNIATAFPAAVGETTVDFNGTTERLLFTMFDATVRPDRICEPGGTGVSGNPVPNQRWSALSGKMIIKTTQDVNNVYKSTIYLKDVVFTNLTNTAVTFNLNDIVQVTTDGYVFGIYTHTHN